MASAISMVLSELFISLNFIRILAKVSSVKIILSIENLEGRNRLYQQGYMLMNAYILK